MRLKEHDAPGREVVRNDDLGIRALGVRAFRNCDLWDLHEFSGHSPESAGIGVDLIGREVDLRAVQELGLRAAKLDRRDFADP